MALTVKIFLERKLIKIIVVCLDVTYGIIWIVSVILLNITYIKECLLFAQDCHVSHLQLIPVLRIPNTILL